MVNVKVRKTHIKHGEPGVCRGCPIALAINDLLKGSFYAVVSDYTVSIRDAVCSLRTMSLPYAAQMFICHFDSADEPRPFSFDLNVPAEFLKDGSCAVTHAKEK